LLQITKELVENYTHYYVALSLRHY